MFFVVSFLPLGKAHCLKSIGSLANWGAGLNPLAGRQPRAGNLPGRARRKR